MEPLSLVIVAGLAVLLGAACVRAVCHLGPRRGVASSARSLGGVAAVVVLTSPQTGSSNTYNRDRMLLGGDRDVG